MEEQKPQAPAFDFNLETKVYEDESDPAQAPRVAALRAVLKDVVARIYDDVDMAVRALAKREGWEMWNEVDERHRERKVDVEPEPGLAQMATEFRELALATKREASRSLWDAPIPDGR